MDWERDDKFQSHVQYVNDARKDTYFFSAERLKDDRLLSIRHDSVTQKLEKSYSRIDDDFVNGCPKFFLSVDDRGSVHVQYLSKRRISLDREVMTDLTF